MDADDYEALFGAPDEDDTERVTLCIQIPADLNAIIRANASAHGQTLTAYITGILSAAVR